MINSKVYDHESVKVMLPTGQIFSCEDISYGVKKDADVVNDKNGVPRGVVRKGFEGDFSMKMSLEEFELLNLASAPVGILAMGPIPVVVTYGDFGTVPIIDKLEVKITETSRKSSKDSEVMMELKGKQTSIPVLNGVKVVNPVAKKLGW